MRAERGNEPSKRRVHGGTKGLHVSAFIRWDKEFECEGNHIGRSSDGLSVVLVS